MAVAAFSRFTLSSTHCPLSQEHCLHFRSLRYSATTQCSDGATTQCSDASAGHRCKMVHQVQRSLAFW